MNIRFYLFDVCVRVRASVWCVNVRMCVVCVCVCVCVCVFINIHTHNIWYQPIESTLLSNRTNISIIMKKKKYLKKFNQLSNTEKIFQLLLN